MSALKSVAVLIGVNSYDINMLAGFTDKYYNNLTPAEIKLAFEFSLTTLLDEYLPVDSSGNVQKEHYNKFDVRYYSKIINAYIAFKRDLITKVLRAKQQSNDINKPKQILLPNNEINQARIKFVNTIYDAFDIYKSDKSKEPEFISEMLVINELINSGLISDTEKISDKELNMSFISVLLHAKEKNISDIEQINIRQQKEKHSIVIEEARSISYKQKIKDCFDKLISENKHIKDYLK